jgi:hypothetical protein
LLQDLKIPERIVELNKARALKGGNVHLCGNARAKFAIIIGVH